MKFSKQYLFILLFSWGNVSLKFVSILEKNKNPWVITNYGVPVRLF